METGKSRNRKRYFSVVLIPHFNSDVKTYKLSSPFPKLAAIVTAFLVLQVAFICVFVRIYDENSRLKNNITVLTAANNEQRNMLEEKKEQIENLIENDERINTAMKDFLSKYQQISDKYIEDRMNFIKTSRSSGYFNRSIINDLDELKKLIDNLEDLNASNSEKLKELAETEQKLMEYLDSMPTMWPVNGEISSGYGSRDDPIKPWKEAFHKGIDIAADHGTDIRASATGKVTMASYIDVYGNALIIDHGNGLSTFYGHASKLLVKEGQAVKKGEVIARVGSTGRSTGPHLHFEIRLNGNPVDPLEYLDD